MSDNQWPDDMDLLHIYPQWEWHGDAQIWGTRVGLTLLRDAINRALESGADGAGVMASDGESYWVTVHLSTGAGFDKLGNQYTSDITGEHSPPDNTIAIQMLIAREKAARQQQAAGGRE